MKDERAAVGEFEGLDLGDVRRDARVRGVVEALQRDPAAPFPKALGTVASREAFYRLVNNDAVSLDALTAPHGAQTIARAVQDEERTIVAIDKTQFIFEGEGEREGLERLSNNKQGFEAIFALALTPGRRSHGVLAVETLQGKGRSTADLWHAFLNRAGSDLEGTGVRPIYVMDREADTYALFCKLVDDDRDFVVRVSFNRFIHEFDDSIREPIRAVMERQPTILTRTVHVNRRKAGGRSGAQRAKHPTRTSRDVTLSIRAGAIILPRPPGRTLGLVEDLGLNLVQVIELDPPPGEVAIEWLLITPLPIDDARCVETIVDAYRARWRVEEFFKALKTGCKYETRQLESRHALENALGLLIPIAWRLLELRTIGEEEPDAAATDVLDADELHVLRRLSRDIKLGPQPTCSQVLLAIASLGGHIRQNGRPGWQVLFGGFKELLDRVEGYRLAKAETCRHRRSRVPVPPASPGPRDPPGGTETVLRLHPNGLGSGEERDARAPLLGRQAFPLGTVLAATISQSVAAVESRLAIGAPGGAMWSPRRGNGSSVRWPDSTVRHPDSHAKQLAAAGCPHRVPRAA